MSTVNQKMTAIADNIRSFTGATEPLTLDDMAQGINDVYKAGQESGGDGYDKGYEAGIEAGQKSEYDRFWDTFQNYGNRTNYRCAFGGGGWGAETFKPKYTPIKLEGNRADNMFLEFMSKETNQNKVSITADILDLSECTSALGTFRDSTFDSVIVDLGNATTLQQTFNMGNGISNGIRSITLKVTDKCTSYNSTFLYSTNLEEMIFTEDSVIGANISFAQSKLLTHESLISIINALKDYSATTTTRTLTLHANSKALLTDSEKAIATQKGWTIA